MIFHIYNCSYKVVNIEDEKSSKGSTQKSRASSSIFLFISTHGLVERIMDSTNHENSLQNLFGLVIK